MDKRERSERFQERLTQAMADAGSSQSALARQIGADRSTISQILSDTGARLPNAQLVAECAMALGVSADWLLGLTDRPESAADLMAASLSITDAPRAMVDEQIMAWHREAEGYKVRHVPASLPDMMKTTQMLEWEYAPHLGRTPNQAVNTALAHLDWMRSSKSDYEIALPEYELISFARAEGYYTGLSRDVRIEQLDRIDTLHEQLYPSLRVFPFDARRVYSAPITIFGPLLAVIYLGRNYVGFRDTERVRGLTLHFDWLVRESSMSARAWPAFIRALRDEVR